MVIDNDGGVDVGSNKGLADGVKVHLIGGGRIAHRDSNEFKSRKVSLGIIDGRVKSLQILDFNLLLFLADVNYLEFARVFCSSLKNSKKFRLIL